MWGAVLVIFITAYYSLILPMIVVNEKRKREANTMLQSKSPYLLSISRTIEEV
jgi:hypothetical protein